MEKCVFSFVCKYGSLTQEWKAMHLNFVSRKEGRIFSRASSSLGRSTFDQGETTLSATCWGNLKLFLIYSFLFCSFTNFLERKRLHKPGKIITSTLLDCKHHVSRGHISSSFLLSAQPGPHHIQEVHSLQVTENPLQFLPGKWFSYAIRSGSRLKSSISSTTLSKSPCLSTFLSLFFFSFRKNVLNLLGIHWLIKLYRYQVYSSITHHLYIALCVPYPKSSLLLSTFINISFMRARSTG